MKKCSACANNLCEGKYENRKMCKDENCSCYCKRTKVEVIFTSLLSIGVGVAVTTVGIGLTVATGGVAAIVAGTAVVGAGSSLISSPVQKLVTGECVTFTDSVKEVALGATTGALTGPIGALGSTASKGAAVAVKIGARMLASSAAGATSGAISEGAKILKGEEVSWESLGKSVAIGAISGAVGGTSTSLAHSSVCKPLADALGKPVVRVITQAGTSMATDAGVQLATTGEIDPKLMLANMAGQLASGTGAEAASEIAQRRTVFAERLNNKHIKKFNKNEPDKSKHLTPLEIKDIKKVLVEANKLNQKQMDSLFKKSVSKKERVLIGDHKIHSINDKLAGDFGQIPSKGYKRSPNRVLMKNHKGNFVYDGHIREHNYRNILGKPDEIRNPLRDILRNDQISTHLINNIENDDEDDEAKSK